MKTLPSLALIFSLAVVPAAGQCPAEATFYQFDRALPYSHMVSEFDQMAQCGISTVTILASATLSTDLVSFVPGGLFGGTIANPVPDGRLENFLRLANLRGFKVIVGLVQPAGNWYEPQWWTPLRSADTAIANKILSLYGGTYNSLAGWYDPIELEVNWIPGSGGASYYGLTRLKDLVTDMNTLSTQFGKSMRVTIAPIFKPAGYGSMPGITAQGYKDALRTMFSATGIKSVWPQDGIGANIGGPSLDQLDSYFAAAKQAATEYGVDLWDTVEVFESTTGVPDGSWFKPAPITRVNQQIAAAKRNGLKVALWNFGHQLSRQATHWPVEAGTLYRNYLKSYNRNLAPGDYIPATYDFFRLYGDHVVPPAAWGDPLLKKLTDRTGGGYGPGTSPGGDWVGVPIEDSNGELHLVLNIGGRPVYQIRVLFRSETSGGIYFPSKMTVESSGDGINYTQFGEVTTFPENTPQFSVFWGDVAIPTIRNQPAAQWVRIKIAHSTGWVMMAETEVFGLVRDRPNGF